MDNKDKEIIEGDLFTSSSDDEKDDKAIMSFYYYYSIIIYLILNFNYHNDNIFNIIFR
jgi:hypothetical protein